MQRIITIGKHLHSKNLLAAADGNISYRFSDQSIVITPSGINKSFLDIKDLAWITVDNQIIKGVPSSERLMHLEVYKQVPEAKAIIHAHPPTAIAWSLARPTLKEIPTSALPEVIIAAGKIPVIPYARPGSLEMGRYLHPYIPESRLMLLSRHGAISWGESLIETCNGIERIEQIASILKAADELGGTTDLPRQEIIALQKLRKKIGPKII